MADVTSSLVGSLDATVELKSPPEKFHDMFVGRPHKIPVASPSNIQGCEILEGENLGSVSFWNYVHDGEAKVVTVRLDLIDFENNRATYTVLDGHLMKEYKSFVVTFQVTPKEGEPGSVVHWHIAYEKISEEVAHPETLLGFALDVSKEMDAHLLSEE